MGAAGVTAAGYAVQILLRSFRHLAQGDGSGFAGFWEPALFFDGQTYLFGAAAVAAGIVLILIFGKREFRGLKRTIKTMRMQAGGAEIAGEDDGAGASAKNQERLESMMRPEVEGNEKTTGSSRFSSAAESQVAPKHMTQPKSAALGSLRESSRFSSGSENQRSNKF